MSYNKRENKKNTVVSTVVAVVLLIVIVVLIFLLVKRQDKNNTAQPTASAQSPGTPTAEPTPSPTVSPTPEPTPTTSDFASPSPTPQSAYDYSNPVPQSEPVELEFFEDAIFIGDSRMEDFAAFSGLAKYATFYTHIGVTVNHLISENESEVIRFRVNGESLTLEETLRKYNDFSKVYIMLGYNELGWPYPEEFIKYYVKVLDIIKEANPASEIYVECVIPVARTITGSGVDPETENNENIARFNRYIREMCKEQKVYFLNVQEALVDSEGYLPDGAASDGIHMKKEYCIKWLDYIKCHVVSNQ
ncbi:MAG TPA: hypothetical protein DEF06_04375 [Clostridiales bacterium]|uniref:SGNH hydrolase-type esterase domain-containing protein n=1 Tax=Candidatus Egerieisoma faecipullorum TaxID=2840963 RepID=A0A9D1I845_9CLOT|nr:hypothetical protein [Clostridiales bacterium]HIU29891.1 hypothetical protein [Candidatus Egerieisoma faecipullorum]